MVRLGYLGLQKKIFIYVGAGLLLLMTLLTMFSLQTISRGTDMIRQQRLTSAKYTASYIGGIVNHLQTEIVEEAALILGRSWQDDLTDSHRRQLASLQSHIQKDLAYFYQMEQDVFLAVLDTRGKVLWTEPDIAQGTTLSLADTAAFQKAMATGQVCVEVKQSLLTQDSPTFSLVVPIKDNQGALKGALVIDMGAELDPIKIATEYDGDSIECVVIPMRLDRP